MNKITIEKILNGYIVYDKYEIEDNKYQIDKTVIEELDNCEMDDEFKTNDDELITLGKLLKTIAEKYGYNYDKFKENNLSITFDKKGSKLED